MPWRCQPFAHADPPPIDDAGPTAIEAWLARVRATRRRLPFGWPWN
jgi:hypothetical protein